jgi:hypothetical protein
MTANEKNKYKNLTIEICDTKVNDPYIFVSYSRSNELYVKKALNDLVDANFRIWYDTAISEEGENNFKKVLLDKIIHCDVVLMFISKQSMNSDWCGREILEAYKHDKELRCFALIEDDHIEGTEHEVTDIIPPMLYSYICENNQIVTYEMKEDAEEDDIESWRKSIESLIAILPDSTRQALEYEDQANTIVKACHNNKKSISLPQTVSTIREYVFRDRENLAEFDFGAVSRIEDGAFEGCKSLKEIRLPNTIHYFGEYIFKDCESLDNIIFGSEISFLGEGMFDGCISLKSIRLPEPMVDISTGLFNGCSSLKKVIFPQNLKTIGESAFENCANLEFENGTISDEIRIIDDQAFAKCDHLSIVKLPPKLIKIGKSVFKDCDSLKEVVIGKDVSYIGGSPFRGCQKLQNIRVNERNKYFRTTESDEKTGNVLYNKNRSDLICYPAGINEKSYKIPDSVTTICEWSFAYSQLEHIEISDSVDIIRENAFFKCRNLKEIRLPDGVTVLDDMAFRKCEKLQNVFIPSSVSRIGYAVFSGCEKVRVICDNEDSLAYKTFSHQSSVECVCKPKEFA